MSDKHLRKGSTNPPLQEGKLRLYSMRYCPFSQRVHLVLDAKKIPYDVVYVNVSEKPEWMFDKNPYGNVPTIELPNNETLYESLIIADYLDEKYTQRPLHSRDPLKKAKDKLLIDKFSKVIGVLHKIQYRVASNLSEEFLSALDGFQDELQNKGTPYFGGSKPGMVDFMIWPWCERADVLKALGGDKFVLEKTRFKHLLNWRQAMREDEAVKGSYLEPSVHAKYFQSRMAGCPDYDLWLRK